MKTFLPVLPITLSLLAGVLISLCPVVYADDANATYHSANESYEAGDYNTAASKYLELVDEARVSSELFYNLGTTRYRQGEEGESILWLRRALLVEPGMIEARQNLEFLRAQLAFLEFDISQINRILRSAPSNLGRWVGTLCIWGALFGIAGAFVVERLRPNRSTLITLSIILLMFSLVGFQLQQYQERNIAPENFATITGTAVAAMTAPFSEAKSVIDLPPGSEVRLLQNSGNWSYVDIPGDLRGWIKSNQIQPVWPISPSNTP